jgi:RNA polymerase sigma-70 factor, ECF subfamily
MEKYRTAFSEESSLFTWLYRIATNESLTFINQKKRHSIAPLNEANEYLQHNLEADEYFDGDDIQKKLQQAIIRLPDKQRLVFNMRYFEEMPYQEMSDILEYLGRCPESILSSCSQKSRRIFNWFRINTFH